ncbi:MAG TPA: hypothetical protein VF213_08365 [Dongiaceae bacterium]
MAGSVKTAAISPAWRSSARASVGVVPWEDDHLLLDALGLASAHQNGHGRLARARLVEARLAADEGVVEPAVILAFELHIFLAAGMGARETERGMNCL